jgi:hypothetical protein
MVKMDISLCNVHMREKMKIMIRTRSTRKTRNSQRRSPMGLLMSVKSRTRDESSESESDDLATIAIKGESSSSKSLFPKLSNHTCLLAKEDKKKVKYNTPSSPKYVTSDEDMLSSDDNDDDASSDGDSHPSEFCKDPKTMIKGLMKQVRVRDDLLE